MNEMGPPPPQELRAPWDQMAILANRYSVGQNWVSASKSFIPEVMSVQRKQTSYLAGTDLTKEAKNLNTMY